MSTAENASHDAAVLAPYRQWAARVRRLTAAVEQLEPLAQAMQLPRAAGQAWHGELFEKLLPQLDDVHPLLVVAVTGGTNTGKSTLFNQLAGSEISRAAPEASGTKHPVCLLPRGAEPAANGAAGAAGSLARLFGSFQARAWQSEADAVAAGDDNLLIYRHDPSGRQPPRLILLDTPDIDSVLRENWRRAELVRYAADVLVCVLTGQKYNDAAVVDFFREAAQSDKTIIVVFNFVEWPDDADACGRWLHTFAQRTGVHPSAAYAAIYDRAAAREHRLTLKSLTPGATDLERDLAELKFAEIKIRSFRGSLRHVLHAGHGLPAYLQAIRDRAGQYDSARDQLRRLVQVRNVQPPRLPPHLIWDPVAEWLRPHRNPAERMVNGFYHWIGDQVTRPFRRGHGQIEEEFRRAEWETLNQAVLRIFDVMQALREGRDPILVQALGELEDGERRRQILDALRVDYDALPLQPTGFREYLAATLDEFAGEHPKMLGSIRYGLIAGAVVRPLLTITFMGLSVHEFAAHVTVQAATDAAIAVGSEVAVQGGGKMAVVTLLRKIYQGYYEQRCTQLVGLLNQHLIGSALLQIDRLADVASDPSLAVAGQIMDELGKELDDIAAR